MIIKYDKEGNKIIAINLNSNPIDDRMDIINKQKEHINVKVIDESITENDHSNQHVHNTTG